MIKLFKKKINTLLRYWNRWLLYSPPGVPTGVDLAHDLGVIFNCQDPVIFDVGANIGQSIELFRMVRSNCSIYAFEPTEVCYNALSQKAYGSRVKLFPIALSDREEIREFYQFEDSVFNSLLLMDRCPENRFSGVKETTSIFAATRTIDALVDELNISCIDLLKIDTQGFDHHVLLGAHETFNQAIVKAVLIELNFAPMYKNQDTAEAIMSYLVKHDFKLVDFYEKVRQSDAIAWCTALYVRRQ